MYYAGLVRPVIDRVYASLRAAARPRLIPIYERAGLGPGLESDYYFALLDHPVPATSVAEAMTYRVFDEAAETARGVAAREDGAWHLTGDGRDLALEVYAAIGAAAGELWAHRPIATMPALAAVERLSELVGALLEAGRPIGGPAFAGMVPVYVPPQADAATVLTARLGALRHFRADAHRAAWRVAGLTAEEIRALSPGPQRRRIEVETDVRDELIYEVLGEDERLELLAGLGALPDRFA